MRRGHGIVLVMLALLFFALCQAASPVYPPPGASAIHADFSAHLASAASLEKTRGLLDALQRVYRLRPGYFNYEHPYLSSHYATIRQHLEHPSSRFARILADPTSIFYASPSQTHTTGEQHRALILLRIIEDGTIMPMGYTGAVDEVVRHLGASFLDVVSSHATLTWGDLQRSHNNARLLRI